MTSINMRLEFSSRSKSIFTPLAQKLLRRSEMWMSTGNMTSKKIWPARTIFALFTSEIPSFFMNGRNVSLQTVSVFEIPQTEFALEISSSFMNGSNMTL